MEEDFVYTQLHHRKRPYGARKLDIEQNVEFRKSPSQVDKQTPILAPRHQGKERENIRYKRGVKRGERNPVSLPQTHAPQLRRMSGEGEARGKTMRAAKGPENSRAHAKDLMMMLMQTPN